VGGEKHNKDEVDFLLVEIKIFISMVVDIKWWWISNGGGHENKKVVNTSLPKEILS
jgi:hypothetical protein